MYKKSIFTVLTIAMAASALSGCTATGPVDAVQQGDNRMLLKATPLPMPTAGDDGVVVAESVPTPTGVDALSMGLSTADCVGESHGVQVNTSQGDSTYIFGEDGKPCGAGDIIFNGRDKEHQRMPSTAVDLTFLDSYGPTVQQKQKLLDDTVPVGMDVFTSAVSEEKIASDERKVMEKAAESWREQKGREQEMREVEKLLADVRGVYRMNDRQVIEAQQNKMIELASRLRESERRLNEEKNRQVSTLEKLQHSRGAMDTDRMAWEQQQRKLRTDQEQLRMRIQQLQSANRHLKDKNTEKEVLYKNQISTLTHNLKDAEVTASDARQVLVLEAAKKIAEAERLAYEAKLTEKEAMEREAARLKVEANTMVSRADAMIKGRSLSIPKMDGVPDLMAEREQRKQVDQKVVAEQSPLESMQVMVHAKGETLENVFSKIFTDMKPKVGAWDITWELRNENQAVRLEKWTVTAEATFDEFLAYVVSEVRKIHGVNLTFKRFDKSRVFVISD